MIQPRIINLPPRFGDEVLDYELDWTLALDGDTLTDVVPTVPEGSPLVITNDSHTDTKSKLTIGGGGTAAGIYRVNILGTTASGLKIGVQYRVVVLSR